MCQSHLPFSSVASLCAHATGTDPGNEAAQKREMGEKRAEQQNKVTDRLNLDFENLNFKNIPTKVQTNMASGLLFSLLTAQISLNPLSKI